MIRNSLDQWEAMGKLGDLRGYRFVVGKPIPDLTRHDRRKTIVVGDCAMSHAHEGTFIPGCSVSPLAVVKALALKGKVVPLKARYRDLLAGVAARLFNRQL